MVCFCKILCQFLLACFKIRMSKISHKTDKFLLNYSNVFLGVILLEHSV